jgi:hypothetical protein
MKFLRVIRMFRRLAYSLLCHWQAQHKKPKYKTTTNFQNYVEDHLRRAFRFVFAAQPGPKPAS